MAYIGKEPVNGFHKKQSLTTDGSTVTFSLDFTVASEESIIVVVGGVIQEPDTAYTVSGTQLTFTAAPDAGSNVYVVFLGKELMDKIKEDMKDIGKVELHPKFDGKQMIMVIQPL